jgi:hypothetical protein
MRAMQVGKSAVGSRTSGGAISDLRLPTSDAKDRTARLRQAIANLRGAGTEGRHTPEPGRAESVDLTPKSAHEAITRQMVTDLAADVAEVKTRVNAVLWLLASAVAIDVVMRLAGMG